MIQKTFHHAKTICLCLMTLLLSVSHALAAITVKETKGWLESAYITFQPYSGAAKYNVYIKGGQYDSYTKLDYQLVREYDGYVRADAVGLKAGTYQFRIEGVTAGGTLVSGATAETGTVSVKSHKREGFAHLNWSKGIGAYKNDGTLKSGAKVIYVTAANAKTISTDVVTNSKGGTTKATGLQNIIYNYQKGYDTTPLAIRIVGCIKAANMDSFASSAEGIQIKGAKDYQEMNITIEGIGDDASVHGFGFLIRNVSSIELRNFAILDCMDDCVSLDTKNSHIWVHNLDLFYGQAGSDADQKKGDGTVDLKGDSRYITISYNHFWDSGKSSLCGMKSETGPNYITYHNNWFDHSDSRHPRIRTMSTHIYNNYYDGNAKYGVGMTYGGSAFVDRNYFRNCKYPMLISMQGSDIASSGGTFSSENGGVIKSYGNYMTGQKAYKPWSASNTVEFDAYEVSSPSVTVPSSVKAKQGGTSYDNFDTNSSLMYSYTPLAVDAVPADVKAYAGRINGGDLKYTFSSKDDEGYAVIDALKNAVVNYSNTELKSIAGYGSGDEAVVAPGGDDSGSTDDPTNPDDSGNSGSTGETGGSTPSGDSTTGSYALSSTSGSTTTYYFQDKGTSTASALKIVTGSYKTGLSITYGGVAYSTGLKMETSTSAVLTLDKESKIVLVFDISGKRVKINGDTYTTNSSCMVEETLAAGTYTITKGDAMNLMAVAVTPTNSVPAPVAPAAPTYTIDNTYSKAEGGYYVKLSCATQGAEILYSLDGGSTWKEGNEFYAAGVTVKAKAKANELESSVTSFNVAAAPKMPTPTITCEDKQNGTAIVTITSSEAGTIYYTLDGSTPTMSSNVYNSAFIVVVNDCTVKAIVTSDTKLNSDVASAQATVTNTSGSGDASQTTAIYSYDNGTEAAGTHTLHGTATDTGNIYKFSNSYYTNGEPTNYVELTPTKALAGGEKLTASYSITTSDAAKSCTFYVEYGKMMYGDYVKLAETAAQPLTSSNLSATDMTFTVPAQAEGATLVRIARNPGGTALTVSKVLIEQTIITVPKNSEATAEFYLDGSKEAITFDSNGKRTISLDANNSKGVYNVSVTPAQGATVTAENAEGSGTAFTINAPTAGNSVTATFTVTSEDGNNTKTYIIIIKRNAASGIVIDATTWDYSSQAPQNNPDNNLSYNSKVDDAQGTNLGLKGIKFDSNGFAYFTKAAVAGTLSVTYGPRKSGNSLSLNVYSTATAGVLNGESPIKTFATANTQTTASVELTAEQNNIYIKRASGSEGVITKIVWTPSQQVTLSDDATATFILAEEGVDFVDDAATKNIPSADAATSLPVVIIPAAGAKVTATTNATGSGNAYTIAVPAKGQSVTATFTITAENGTTTKVYSITVNKTKDVRYLVDRENYTDAQGGTYDELTFEKSLTGIGKWTSLYIPFGFDITQHSADFDVAEIFGVFPTKDTNDNGYLDADDEINLIVNVVKTGVTVPNMPYLIKPKREGTAYIYSNDGILSPAAENSVTCSTTKNNYFITGLYHTETVVANDGKYYMGGGVLSRRTSGSTNVAANRWIMTVKDRTDGYNVVPASAKINIFVIGDEDATDAIKQIEQEIFNGNIYTIDGRRLPNAEHIKSGIYINNGKKIVK